MEQDNFFYSKIYSDFSYLRFVNLVSTNNPILVMFLNPTKNTSTSGKKIVLKRGFLFHLKVYSKFKNDLKFILIQYCVMFYHSYFKDLQVFTVF